MWKGIIVNQLPFNAGCRNVSIISNNTSICKQKWRFLTSVAGLLRSVVNVSTLTCFTSYIFYSFIWNLELLNNYRLLHGIFHIGPGISPRLPYQARQRSWRTDMGRGLIPGPIWKMPCNDLFITYFQAEEIRIYVKHNFNMNIFIMNITF